MPLLTSLSHHATLFVHADRKQFTENLWNELRSLSPAHILHDHTVVDIDTARSLTSWANTPYDSEKIALISFHTITLPAQNALLKILEEPRDGVRFILVTTNSEALIPTLLSRLQHHHIENVTSNKNNTELFLTTPPKERMKLPSITSLLSAVDEEGRKDRENVRAFILSLANTLNKKKEYSYYVPIILEMGSYAADPSSSGKALIEYLSLLLPQTKL
jgi:hypothetical protein